MIKKKVYKPRCLGRECYHTYNGLVPQKIKGIFLKPGCPPEIYKGMYINLSRWCNQPAQYSKKSLREFCTGQGEYSSCFRYLTAFEALHPEMAHYLDMKYEEVQYGKIYG